MKLSNKSIIITADDLGIDQNINKGIIESFQKGILTSSALLMNAPCTDEGIKIAKQLPNLEVGIHLSIVEGISLRGKKSTITDELKYFNNQICLIRDWKTLLKKYFLNKLSFRELEEELELQIVKFLDNFRSIPFLNGTQHMHIMPKIWKIVLKLCLKYDIKAIRLPNLSFPSKLWLNKRFPFLIPFQILGKYERYKIKNTNICVPEDCIGMQFSGHINEQRFKSLVKHAPNGISEIIMHPGYESHDLRKQLPWAYSNFNWECELNTLTSNKIKEFIHNNNIKLCKFSDLNK